MCFIGVGSSKPGKQLFQFLLQFAETSANSRRLGKNYHATGRLKIATNAAQASF